jgi:APA family basic amino acid/polyamine antiporter
MGLIFFLSAALFAFFRAYTDPENSRRPILLFWGALGMAALAKGPAAVVLATGIIGLFLLLRGDLRRTARRLCTPGGILLFLLVAASYAEGTAAIPETGGAAMFVRRAYNDQAGFLTGWVLFLDYVIVIALAALFAPHYLGTALGWDGIRDKPWDVVIGIGIILGVAGIRLIRRPGLYGLAIVIAAVAVVSHVLLTVLGGIWLVSTQGFGSGVIWGEAPSWYALAFSLPLAMLAYTGLETVANLASDARTPGRTLPRSLFIGIGAAVFVAFAMAVIGLSAYPPHRDPAGPNGWATDLGTEWIRAPLVGITDALNGPLPERLVDVLRVFVGVSGTFVLIAAVSTSM